MTTQVFNHFKKGFLLTNKSYGLFLFGLSFSLLFGLPDFLRDSFIKGALQVIGFLTIFISFGFSFSLPLFLVDKQEGKSFNFRNILSTTFNNTKRLLFPFILILLSIIVVMVVLSILISQFVYGGSYNFMQNSGQGFNIWNFLNALFVGLFSFGTFTSVYFSIEKN